LNGLAQSLPTRLWETLATHPGQAFWEIDAQARIAIADIETAVGFRHAHPLVSVTVHLCYQVDTADQRLTVHAPRSPSAPATRRAASGARADESAHRLARAAPQQHRLLPEGIYDRA
jgi:hypothetical protein